MDFQSHDVKVGAGPQIALGDTVRLLYRVFIADGHNGQTKLVESNLWPEEPIEVRVLPEHLLPGILRGLVGMRSGGGVRRLVIPPELALGERDWMGIPGGSTLEIEICVPFISSTAGLVKSE